MLSHKKIWTAIDRIAKDYGMSPSGLAKKAGLDPTSFNKSKRIGSGGKLRWPSTESLYKILKVLGKDLSYFSSIVEPNSCSEISIVAATDNDSYAFYDLEENSEWEKVSFPRSFSKDIVAIKVKGYSLDPIYRNGDVLVVNTKEKSISEDDRVVIKTAKDELLVKRFYKKDEKNLFIKFLDGDETVTKIPTKEVEWVAKIIWVTQ